MSNDNELRRLLSSFIKDNSTGMATLLGRVKDVDSSNCTCTLTDDGIDYFDVRLRPVVGENKGFLAIPKKNTHALAVKIEESQEWMLIACSEVEKVELIVNRESIYDIVCDLIKAIRTMKFITNAGPTIDLVELSKLQFDDLQDRIDNIFKI